MPQNLYGARIAFIGMKNAQKNAIIQTVFVFITDGANQIGSALTGNGRTLKVTNIGEEMTVELTNHFVEMSQIYDIEKIDENKYGGKLYFRFYFGNGKWSKEYHEPTYTYRILKQ